MSGIFSFSSPAVLSLARLVDYKVLQAYANEYLSRVRFSTAESSGWVKSVFAVSCTVLNKYRVETWSFSFRCDMAACISPASIPPESVSFVLRKIQRLGMAINLQTWLNRFLCNTKMRGWCWLLSPASLSPMFLNPRTKWGNWTARPSAGSCLRSLCLRYRFFIDCWRFHWHWSTEAKQKFQRIQIQHVNHKNNKSSGSP